MALAIVSSNGKPNSIKSEAVGKSYQPIEITQNDQLKASSLKLDLDIINLRDWFKKYDLNLTLCQTTMHKTGSLKKRKEILESIKNYSKLTNSYHDARIYFTGHGYANGDLCIETAQNPDGERLTIQEILDIAIECMMKKNTEYKSIFILIDSCYSGRNIERVRTYILTKKPKMIIGLWCSSGPYDTSIVTEYGSLLIAKECQSINPKILNNKHKLAQQFQARNPVWLHYKYKNGEKQQKVGSWKIKF